MKLKTLLKKKLFILLILPPALFAVGCQKDGDPVIDATDNIIDSLETRDKELFDNHVDLDFLAKNISTWAIETALENDETLQEKGREEIENFFKEEVIRENKERLVRETEEYFDGTRNDLIGPLNFLHENGRTNRSNSHKAGLAQVVYTPPEGVDDSEKAFFFELRKDNWVLINAWE